MRLFPSSPAKELDFSKRTCIMGVLNVTPDSFSDAGMFYSGQKAVSHALRMAGEGAGIIDIGGESTRPGSEPLPADEELKRVIPVIEAIRKQSPVPISIDTYKADIARRAVEAGASIINDISGMRFDPLMPQVAASLGVPVVLMHIKGTPRDMQKEPVYEALIPEILDYLRESIRIAEDAGVHADRIIIDPGIGFGKTFDHNLEILKNLGLFTGLGKPVLVGASRKAFIGRILGGAPPLERLEGTLAAHTAAILNGASIIRAHDVKEAVRAARVADAIKRGRIE
ncbi:MAG: dihydropteroate synthase [Nitrospiraceae bacterium]|nr:dihydropteroate synthase [Nitrospiraceae bacterium]